MIKRHSAHFFFFFLFPLGNFLLIGSSIVSGSVSLSVTADERISAVHTEATGTGRLPDDSLGWIVHIIACLLL